MPAPSRAQKVQTQSHNKQSHSGQSNLVSVRLQAESEKKKKKKEATVLFILGFLRHFASDPFLKLYFNKKKIGVWDRLEIKTNFENNC